MSQYQYGQQSSSGFIAAVTGTSTFGEITLATVILLVILALVYTAEGVYTGVSSFSERFQILMDYTASSQDKALVIHQDANKYPDAKILLPSENEPSGVEFAYSFFLYVNPATFNSSGQEALYHVWHKGYGCGWPLMGPGVFITGATNSLRVVMNTYENPYTYVDVTNIPIKKWFHVVLNCKKGGLEVHINGNLANKLRFDKTLPYMNYQDIVLFSNANFVQSSTTPALGGNSLHVSGTFNGFMSQFIYARYALSFTEIQSLFHGGPSKKLKTQTIELPPYLADTWWTTKYTSTG